MATTTEGLTVPTGGDAFDPQGDMVTLANGFQSRIVVPVANTTERASLLAAISWTPSAEEPLRVSRGDADPGRELEYTTDSTNWVALMAPQPEDVEDAVVSIGIKASTVELASSSAISSATYDRVVEVRAIVGTSVAPSTSWSIVITSDGSSVTSNVIATGTVTWASTPLTLIGCVALSMTFNLDAGSSAQPKLWAKKNAGTGNLTTVAPSYFQIRTRPRF
jgi:hypothetical protein